MLAASPEQAFPPGYPVTESLYYEGMFALAAAPDLLLSVIIGLRAATFGAGGSHFLGCLFINTFPIIVAPLRANRHYGPPHVITYAVLLYHRPAGHGLC